MMARQNLSHSARRAKRRRVVIALAAWPTTVLSAGALGQPRKPPAVIGLLYAGARSPVLLPAFKEELAVLGWKEAGDYTVEERWGDGQPGRLTSMAEELAAKKPAIIVASLSAAVIAAAKAAPNVPVVQATGASPVASGLAASLRRPGGMVTGVTNLIEEVSEKYVELLLAAAPKLRRVGFLVDPASAGNSTYIENARRAAVRHRVDVHFVEVRQAQGVEAAMSDLAKQGIEGLVILPSAGLFQTESRHILKLAAARRWPVTAGPVTIAEDGALISYSADGAVLARRVAHYVDRILKGAKPGDLPVERPTKFNLVINKKSAKALGIAIPDSLLLQATRVIE